MVDSGYHPLKHHPLKQHPLRIVLGWWTCNGGWMVDSGYHPLKHHPLRIVLGWWTVDIILLSIILLG